MRLNQSNWVTWLHTGSILTIFLLLLILLKRINEIKDICESELEKECTILVLVLVV